MTRLLPVLSLMGLLAMPAQANTFLLTGSLADGDAPADGLFTFELSIFGRVDPTVEVWTETQQNVVVVDGVFAIDVGAVEPLPASLDDRGFLQVTIDGDVLEGLPLPAVVRVEQAAVAQASDGVAQTAETLDGVGPDDVVRRSALAAPGGPGFPFSAITGLPAGVADGDDGVDVTVAGQGLTLGDRRLSVVVGINGDRFASGAIAGSRFAAGAITDVKVANNAVTGAKVGADLTRADLAAAPGEAQIAGRALFNASAAGCDQRGFTTNATCPARVCTAGTNPVNGLPINGRVGCDGTGCAQFNPTTCTNTRIGLLVAP
jgi:hypothetical protein